MTDDFSGAGLTLILSDNNNHSILMAKSNSNKEFKKYVWLFPGGRRNGIEKPYQTAYREFLEEVFNVIVPDEIVNEITNLISLNKNLYPIDTTIASNNSKSSYTFIQSSDAITIFVNVLKKHNIKSDVFPFGYNSLYDSQQKINIYQFCAQRRYINDASLPEKNELVFITMIPLNNLLYSIFRTPKYKDVFHYHGENLKVHVPSSLKYIDAYFKEKEEFELIKCIKNINLSKDD
jgi:hypothetical protein